MRVAQLHFMNQSRETKASGGDPCSVLITLCNGAQEVFSFLFHGSVGTLHRIPSRPSSSAPQKPSFYRPLAEDWPKAPRRAMSTLDRKGRPVGSLRVYPYSTPQPQ